MIFLRGRKNNLIQVVNQESQVDHSLSDVHPASLFFSREDKQARKGREREEKEKAMIVEKKAGLCSRAESQGRKQVLLLLLLLLLLQNHLRGLDSSQDFLFIPLRDSGERRHKKVNDTRKHPHHHQAVILSDCFTDY